MAKSQPKKIRLRSVLGSVLVFEGVGRPEVDSALTDGMLVARVGVDRPVLPRSPEPEHAKAAKAAATPPRTSRSRALEIK